jgi:hypothetical protein
MSHVSSKEVEYSMMLSHAWEMRKKGYTWAVGLTNVPLLFIKNLTHAGPLARQYPAERVAYHAPIDLHLEALGFYKKMAHLPMSHKTPVLFMVAGTRYVGVRGFTWNGTVQLLVKGRVGFISLQWDDIYLLEAGVSSPLDTTLFQHNAVLKRADRKAVARMYLRDVQTDLAPEQEPLEVTSETDSD